MDLPVINAFNRESLSGAARLMAGALVAGLWQGILMCAGAGLTLKLMPKSTARMRFVVWVGVFGVSVALPFVNLHGAMMAARGVQVPGRQLMVDLRWSYLLAAAWMAAVAWRSVALMRQGLRLRSLWKSAFPVTHERLAGLDGPLSIAGQEVEVCTSNEVDRPSVIGFFAPRILVPAWIFDKLTAVELEHIVLHEMEHLRRRDDWMNLAQKIGLAILPLNPALFWIDRRLSAEREVACDDGVLERTKAPRAYAASLTSIAERRLGFRANKRIAALALGATGVFRRRSEFSRRIESILGRRPPVNPAIASGLATMLLVAIFGSAAVLAHLPQLVSFGQGAEGGALAKQVSPPTSVGSFDAPQIRVGHIPDTKQGDPTVRYQNASFPLPARTEVMAMRDGASRPTQNRLAGKVASHARDTDKAAMSKRTHPFVVMTSWKNPDKDAPVSRLVLATPDGRVFLVPIYLHAAVPLQDGWLIVQL